MGGTGKTSSGLRGTDGVITPANSLGWRGSFRSLVAEPNAQLALVAIAFGFAASLVRPFFSNQNTYLVHAAALSGSYPELAADWFTRTLDPTPVFSWLTAAVLAVTGASGLMVANAALGAVFVVGLTLWAIETGMARPESRALVAATIGLAWFALPGAARSVVFHGVADQYVYAAFLQPASAGVAFLSAFWLLVRKRFQLALVLAALPTWVHPTYALVSASFLFAACFSGGLMARTRLRMFGLGLLLLLPAALWHGARFAPSSAAMFAESVRILGKERLAHHANPAVWFGGATLLQLAWLAGSLFAAPREIRRLMVLFVAPGTLLTLIAALPNMDSLRLAFPWRFSGVAIPLGTALILARGSTFLVGRLRGAGWLLAAGFALSATGMAWGKWRKLSTQHMNDVALFASPEFAKARALNKDQSALVPDTWEDVRLNAKARVFVDFKSHPYKDGEVVEWWRRIRLVREFYRGSASTRCETLAQIRLAESVRWVVAPEDGLNCAGANRIASTAAGQIFELASELRD